MEKISALIDKLQELKNSNAGLQSISYYAQLLQAEVLHARNMQREREQDKQEQRHVAVIMPSAAAVETVQAIPNGHTTATQYHTGGAAVPAQTVPPVQTAPPVQTVQTTPAAPPVQPVQATPPVPPAVPVTPLAAPVQTATPAQTVPAVPPVPPAAPVTPAATATQPAYAVPPVQTAPPVQPVQTAPPVSPAASTTPTAPASPPAEPRPAPPEPKPAEPRPAERKPPPPATLFDETEKKPSPLKELKELNERVAQQTPSLNDRLRQNQTELAEKLGDMPVKDLRNAIGINDKFQFIQELFRGDVDVYERSVKTINELHSLQEAEYWIERELKIRQGWEEDNRTVKQFYSLVRKRFS